MQVAKWGNSLAVRLPAAVVEALKLQAGDEIEIVVDDPRRFSVRKKDTVEALMESVREFRGKMPADFKFDREEANSRGR
jgi:antitoxin MazE